jgi:hypothetical protein
VFLGGGGGPDLGRLLEEPGERLGSEAVTGLHDGAAADLPAVTVSAREYEIEMAHDLLDRAVAEQAHADHEPHDVVGGKLAPPHAGLVRGPQRSFDPVGIQGFRKQRKARLRSSPCGLEQRRDPFPPHTSCHGRPRSFIHTLQGGALPPRAERLCAEERRARSSFRLMAEIFSTAFHHAW